MKLKQLRPNLAEIELSDDVIVIFSYAVPVAANYFGTFIRTDTVWSVTTQRHINEWLEGRTAHVVSQSFLDDLPFQMIQAIQLQGK